MHDFFFLLREREGQLTKGNEHGERGGKRVGVRREEKVREVKGRSVS